MKNIITRNVVFIDSNQINRSLSYSEDISVVDPFSLKTSNYFNTVNKLELRQRSPGNNP